MRNTNKLLSLILIGFVFFSCEKDENPILKVYVSSEKSEFFQSVKMDIFDIGMYHVDGGHYSKGVYHEYQTVDFVDGESQFLIRDGEFNEGSFDQFWLNISNVFATTSGGSTTIIVKSREAESCLKDLDFELLPNRQYRIDIIFDLDKSIVINQQDADFQPIAEIKIEEL